MQDPAYDARNDELGAVPGTIRIRFTTSRDHDRPKPTKHVHFVIMPDEPVAASVRRMGEVSDEPVPESPATWENLVVGEVKDIIGHALHDDTLIEEGDEQKEIAHEVRKEYQDEDRD